MQPRFARYQNLWTCCNYLLSAGFTARALAEQLQRTEVLALDFSAAASEGADQTATAASDLATPVTQQHSTSSATNATISRTTSGLEESRQLKAELKARGLSTKGSKAELRARLAGAADGRVPI